MSGFIIFCALALLAVCGAAIGWKLSATAFAKKLHAEVDEVIRLLSDGKKTMLEISPNHRTPIAVDVDDVIDALETLEKEVLK